MSGRTARNNEINCPTCQQDTYKNRNFYILVFFIFFGLGACSSSYIASNKPVKKSLLSTSSTNSISFAPSYGNSYFAFGIYAIAEGAGVSVKTIQRTLKEIDNLKYVGSGNSGHWELNE